MPYLRTFWHFMPKNICIRELYTQLLQNFLQWCYSTILKLELYCSSILKIINILFTFSPEISLSSISLFQFSSLSSFSVSPSALSSLQTQTPFFLLCGCFFFFFWAWVTVWVNGGCGFWRGSLFVVVVVFFFVCDRCLKGLWVVVRFGVWVVAEVSCWSWISKASHDLSLISHHGSASWVWIGGLGSVDGGFETVDLLIGWVDHR